MDILLAVMGAGGLTALGYVLHWIWKHTRYSNHNFHLSFINHPPDSRFADDMIEEPQSLKVLAVGQRHKVYVRVTSACGFRVRVANFRLLDNARRNVPRESGYIPEVSDFHFPGTMRNDGFWGIDLEYAELRVLARGAGLYYLVDIMASTAWSGLLSFRAEDDTGFRSVVQYALEFRMPPNPDTLTQGF